MMKYFFSNNTMGQELFLEEYVEVIQGSKNSVFLLSLCWQQQKDGVKDHLKYIFRFVCRSEFLGRSFKFNNCNIIVKVVFLSSRVWQFFCFNLQSGHAFLGLPFFIFPPTSSSITWRIWELVSRLTAWLYPHKRLYINFFNHGSNTECSLFHMKITASVTKSSRQDRSLCYLDLAIFFLYLYSPLLEKKLSWSLFSSAN